MLRQLKQRLPTDVKYRAKRAVAPVFGGDLTRLARFYGANKPGYLDIYQHHLAPGRRTRRAVLEIGIGGYGDPDKGGGSLRAWRTFFPHAEVHGIDIEPKAIREPRITTHIGSQADVGFLTDLAERFGPFDVVIDDGSHVSEHVIVSFETLFPYVKPGGLYAIEDLGAAYWPKFGGGPPGQPGTSIAMVKDMLDGLNQRAWASADAHEVPENHRLISGLHAYERIVIVEKSRTGPSQYRLGPPA